METRIITCPQCQTQNRISPEKVGQPAKCGKCGMALTITEAAHLLTVTDASFATEVLQSPLPVLVDVWAPWCGPCRMIAPVIEQLATEFADKLKVVKLNSDDNPVIPSQYHVQGIPTLLFVKNGHLVDQVVGAVPKPQLVTKIQQFLAR
jgi:thioredoxin 2